MLLLPGIGGREYAEGSDESSPAGCRRCRTYPTRGLSPARKGLTRSNFARSAKKIHHRGSEAMRRLGLSSPHCLGGKIPFLGASREPSISASPRLRVPIFGTALHTLPDLPADAIIGYL